MSAGILFPLRRRAAGRKRGVVGSQWKMAQLASDSEKQVHSICAALGRVDNTVNI